MVEESEDSLVGRGECGGVCYQLVLYTGVVNQGVEQLLSSLAGRIRWRVNVMPSRMRLTEQTSPWNTRTWLYRPRNCLPWQSQRYISECDTISRAVATVACADGGSCAVGQLL